MPSRADDPQVDVQGVSSTLQSQTFEVRPAVVLGRMAEIGRIVAVADSAQSCNHRRTMMARIRRIAETLQDRTVLVVVLILSPTGTSTAYLWWADNVSGWSTLTDVVAFTIALSLGIVGMILLPLSRFIRALATLAYLSFGGWLLILWGIVWRGGL